MGLFRTLLRSLKICGGRVEDKVFEHQLDNLDHTIDLDIDERRSLQLATISHQAEIEHELGSSRSKSGQLGLQINALQTQAESSLRETKDEEKARALICQKLRLAANKVLVDNAIVSGEQTLDSIRIEITDMTSEITALEHKKTSLCARGGLLKIRRRRQKPDSGGVSNIDKIERNLSIKERENELVQELNPVVPSTDDLAIDIDLEALQHKIASP